MDPIGNKLANHSNAAFDSNPGGKILNKVGNGMLATARTVGMGLATQAVAEKAYDVGRDLFTGAEPSTLIGQASDRILGGFGQAMVLIGLGYATYNCAADTALSAYKGFQQVRAA